MKKFSIFIFYLISILLLICVCSGCGIWTVLRVIIGFIELTILPGIFFIRCLGLDLDKHDELIFLSIVLSVSLDMVYGFIINMLCLPLKYPVFRDSSFILFTFQIFLLFLFVISSKCNIKRNINNINANQNLSLSSSLSKNYIYMCVVGLSLVSLVLTLTDVRYYYNFVLPLIVCLVFVATLYIVLLTDLFKITDTYIVCILVWTYALAAILQHVHYPLYIRGGDIDNALYIHGLVRAYGLWLPNLINENMYSMLSVSILPSLYTTICGISFIKFMKILYPILISTLPVLLYLFYVNYFNKYISYMAVILFTSMYMFYDWLGLCIKQGVAELFLASIFFVSSCRYLSSSKRVFLVLLLSVCTIVSHYGVSYVYLIVLFISILAEKIVKSEKKSFLSYIISARYILFYIVFLLAWYTFTVNINLYSTVISVLRDTIKSFISMKILSPKISYTASVLSKRWNLSILVLKYLYIFVIISTLFGLIFNIVCKKLKNKEVKSDNSTFFILSIGFFAMVISTILPKANMIITPDRIIVICYTFLSPYFIVGLIRFDINNLVNTKFKKGVLLVILLLFFLANFGLLAPMFGDYFPPNIYLNYNSNIQQNVVATMYFFDFYVRNTNIYCANWLAKYGVLKFTIFSDKAHGFQSFPIISEVGILPKVLHIRFIYNVKNPVGYIYIRSLNTKLKLFEKSIHPLAYYNFSTLHFRGYNRIYSSSYNRIYFNVKG